MNAILKSIRLLNTRPKYQSETLSEDIKQLGGVVIDLPTLIIEPTDDSWITQLSPLMTYHKIIFISMNAIMYSMGRSLTAFDATRQQCFTMGESSASLLESYIHSNVIYPSISDSEHLLDLPEFQCCQHENILIIKGVGGRTLLKDSLEQKGANVTEVDVYSRINAPDVCDKLSALWLENAFDIILVTSEQSLLHLLHSAQGECLTWLKQKTFLVISQRLALIAKEQGLNHLIIAPPNKLIDALIDYEKGR